MRKKSLCLAAVLFCVTALYGGVAVKNNDSIVFLGDSITNRGVRFSGGYVNLVMSALRSKGINAKMIPAGIGGNRSREMISRFKTDVLDKKPQIMTLSCGVNDVWHGVRGRGVPLDEFKKNISSMVSQAKNAGIKVYILTATVIYEDPAHDLNKKLVPYNNALRDIAAEQGCALVDVSATMIVALEKLHAKYPDIKGNLLTVDGVHMNPLGDIFMAVTLLKSFGFSDQEIAEAGKNWQDLGMDYDGIRIRNRYMHNLLQLANKNKCSLYEIVNRVLHKALAE